MKRGFTLVELAVVILVLSILSVAVVRYVKNHTLQAKASKFISFVNKVKNAVDYYYDDTGYFPKDTKQLWNNVSGVKNWYGEYLTPPRGNKNLNQFPKTPAGEPAYLECSEGNYVRLRVDNPNVSVCVIVDRQIDDGNLGSGDLVISGGKCYFYLERGNVGCQ
jgi:prepilin-type N-terminal cleavage/methylation domain-containing protein